MKTEAKLARETLRFLCTAEDMSALGVRWYIRTQVHMHTATYAHRYIRTQVHMHTGTYEHRYIRTLVHMHTGTYEHRYI